MLRKLTLGLVFCLLIPTLAHAQYFGQNQVRHRNWTWQLYESSHFSFYHYLELKEENQADQFETVVNQFEMSYSEQEKYYAIKISKKIPVIVFKTHSDFQSDRISGETDMPEGVGAYAEPSRNRIVVKLDFLPPLNRNIFSHEFDHIVYFLMRKSGGISGIPIPGMSGSVQRPLFFIEGSRAEYRAEEISPMTRDDIRRIEFRQIAMNPKLHLPTWDMMESGWCGPSKICNPYIYGNMLMQFIKLKYGSDAAYKFIKNGTTEPKPLFTVLNQSVGDQFESREAFDEAHIEFWEKEYAYLRNKPKLSDDTDNYLGKIVSPPSLYNDTLSPMVSPDGSKIAFFSVDKMRVALMSSSILIKTKDSLAIPGGYNPIPQKEYEVLYNPFPPKPYEYIVVQGFYTWPFNGFDGDWSKDNEISFFAKERDHTLVIVDPETKKVVKEFEIPLDQGFSPVFSPDGKFIYFSASNNTIRDIYRINVENGDLVNLTNDPAFDTASAVSSDGTRLVYVSFVKDFQKLVLLNIESGTKIQLTFNSYNDNSPSFSADGERILYTSDEIVPNGGDSLSNKDRIWNLYTMDLNTKVVEQWTDSSAGIFTPRHVNGTDMRIVLTSWVDRPVGPYRYPAFRIFELVLKKPLRTFVMTDEGQSMDFTFKTQDLFRTVLDEHQINNPDNFRRSWQFRGSEVSFGASTYWGMWGSSVIEVSDILEEHRYLISAGLWGSARLVDFTYVNLESRKYWGYRFYTEKLPLYYQHYGIFEGRPKQNILNETWTDASGVEMFALYPVDKFNRFEFGGGIENKSYNLFGLSANLTDPLIDELGESFNPRDLEFYKFFRDSSGHRLNLQASYVRDTVISSYQTLGQYHGNAFRADIGFEPPLFGREVNNVWASVNVRRYMRLGSSATFAMRGDLVTNKNPDGKYVLMGGYNTLRAYPYGSIAGNQIAYASAELRFPFIYDLSTPVGVIGPLRGILFADYGLAKFSNSNLPTQEAKAYGLGFQFFDNFLTGLPMNLIWARNDLYGKTWKFDFYVSYNW